MKQPEQKQPNKRLEPVAQHDQLKPLVVPVAPEAEPTDQHFRYEPCVHEAGHAVTVYWLGGRIDERGVWVDRENGGMTNFVGGQSIRARQGLLAMVRITSHTKWLEGVGEVYKAEIDLLCGMLNPKLGQLAHWNDWKE